MGTNNRQRRAAKQRQRAQQRTQRGGSRPGPQGFAEQPFVDAAAVVDLHVTRSLRRLARHASTDESPAEIAARLVRSVHPFPRELVADAVGHHLAERLAVLGRGGWSVSDLEELVSRNLGSGHRPTLTAVGRSSLFSDAGLGSALVVTALLYTAPVIEGDHRPAGPRDAEHPRLARVRALLAKAESTPYGEEAEALSAKAQELVTRYALEGLLDVAEGTAHVDPITVRRIWLDAPYVRAKGSLVHVVADANRCRAVLTESLSFSVVVGAPHDLEAVELLVTSLLVQANTAMLRHARTGDGRARTFRRAFLLAYAARIGERLEQVSGAVADEVEARLPVIRDHERRVSAAFEEMIPHTVSRPTTISSTAGWTAGTVAADLALLDVHGRIEDSA